MTDETLVAILHLLPSAMDFVSVALTSSRFGTKCIAAPGDGAGGAAAAAPEMLSLVEEAGRQWVAGCSEQERGWLPCRELESRLCQMHEVEVLRVPLVFGWAHDTDVTLSEGCASCGQGPWRDGAVATRNAAVGPTITESRRARW